MADRKPIPPKSMTIDDAALGQRYTVTFDPNAPRGKQWVWLVDYVRTYRYFGTAHTAEGASVIARKKIQQLNKRKQQQEEDSE